MKIDIKRDNKDNLFKCYHPVPNTIKSQHQHCKREENSPVLSEGRFHLMFFHSTGPVGHVPSYNKVPDIT